MEKRISIKQWIQNYKAGMYDATDIDTQCDAGWYDWFCKSESLAGKTKRLAPKVIKVAELLGEEFQKKHYVFFKNNCPMYGGLYDSFSFCTLDENQDVVYWMTPKSGHKSSLKAELTGREVDFKSNLAEGKWSDIVSYFKTKAGKK